MLPVYSTRLDALADLSLKHLLHLHVQTRQPTLPNRAFKLWRGRPPEQSHQARPLTAAVSGCQYGWPHQMQVLVQMEEQISHLRELWCVGEVSCRPLPRATGVCNGR